MTDIRVGDVCLDLSQGRPVHVVEDTLLDAKDWSEEYDYELIENYGNGRLGATESDAVYDVVYCSSAKSEPSKTYAMPESRLLRVETEQADGGRPVYDRVAREVLTAVFGAMGRGEMFDENDIEALARHVGKVDPDVVDQARELADVEQTIANMGNEADE